MKRYKYLVLVSIAFLIFLMPQLLRGFDNECSLIGRPTYYHARIANLLNKGEFYDPLSFQGRELTYFPMFQVMLALFGDGFKACYFFGPVLGALTILILSLILKKFRVNPFLAIIFALVPIGLYTFGHCNSRAPTYFFGILAFYFLIKDKHLWFMLYLMLGIFAHFTAGLIFSIFSLIYILVNKKPLKYLIFAIILGFVLLLPYLITFGFPEENLIHKEYIRTDTSSLHYSGLTDLIMFKTAYAALDPVIVFITVIFFFRRKDRFLFLLALFSILFAISAERFRIFLAFPFTLVAAKQLNQKRYSLLAIVLILPFTFIMADWLAGMGPEPYFCDAMKFLRENIDEDADILVDWGDGHWVESLTKRKVILDAYAEYAPEVNERYLASIAIYYWKNQTLIRESIEKYSIDYIVKRGNIKDSQDYYINMTKLVYDRPEIKIYSTQIE